MFENKKINYKLLIKSAAIHICVMFVWVFIFATFMYFTESGYKYSPLFATLSIAFGSCAAALYTGYQVGEKGIVIGGLVGVITFIVITLIALIVNSGAVGIHFILRFAIIMLASMIGAIIGVNRKADHKYI